MEKRVKKSNPKSLEVALPLSFLENGRTKLTKARERLLLSPRGFAIDTVRRMEVSYSIQGQVIDYLSSVIQICSRLYCCGGVDYQEYSQHYRNLFFQSNTDG